MSDFEREMGYRNSHPGLRTLFKYLIENGAMVLTHSMVGVNFYYINTKELKKIIDQQEILNAHIKYLENVALLWR